ncbi:hypothetical protein ACE939_10660 [Aquimarina sp. W85]|uniref:hypothetical protein n=1 Tax=Aquimarina rhodophyticola TaxID=3342246 RepID=UPI00366C0403
MKKSTYLLVLLAALTFITCSKDDGNSQSESSTSLITGDWDLTNFEIPKGKSTLEAAGESVITDFTATGKNFSSIISFSENPNTLVSDGSFDTALEISSNGIPAITQEVSGEDYFLTGSWKLEGDKLTITNEALDQTDIATILTLNETSLKFEVSILRTFFIQDIEIKTEGKAIYTLERK